MEPARHTASRSWASCSQRAAPAAGLWSLRRKTGAGRGRVEECNQVGYCSLREERTVPCVPLAAAREGARGLCGMEAAPVDDAVPRPASGGASRLGAVDVLVEPMSALSTAQSEQGVSIAPVSTEPRLPKPAPRAPREEPRRRGAAVAQSPRAAANLASEVARQVRKELPLIFLFP